MTAAESAGGQSADLLVETQNPSAYQHRRDEAGGKIFKDCDIFMKRVDSLGEADQRAFLEETWERHYGLPLTARHPLWMLRNMLAYAFLQEGYKGAGLAPPVTVVQRARKIERAIAAVPVRKPPAPKQRKAQIQEPHQKMRKSAPIPPTFASPLAKLLDLIVTNGDFECYGITDEAMLAEASAEFPRAELDMQNLMMLRQSAIDTLAGGGILGDYPRLNAHNWREHIKIFGEDGRELPPPVPNTQAPAKGHAKMRKQTAKAVLQRAEQTQVDTAAGRSPSRVSTVPKRLIPVRIRKPE